MDGVALGVVIGLISLPGVDFHIQNFSLIGCPFGKLSAGWTGKWLEEMADASYIRFFSPAMENHVKPRP
jgi:hypothetical protein